MAKEKAATENDDKPKVINIASVAADNEKMNEIRAHGFEVQQVRNDWRAIRPSPTEGEDDQVIGPAASIAALHTQVMLVMKHTNEDVKTVPPAEAEDDKVLDEQVLEDSEEEVEIDLGSGGEQYLEGMKPTVKARLKALAEAIVKYDRIKLERVSLSNQESEAKKTMQALLKHHEAELLTDNEKQYKYYGVGNIRGVLAKTEKEEVRTEHIDDDE